MRTRFWAFVSLAAAGRAGLPLAQTPGPAMTDIVGLKPPVALAADLWNPLLAAALLVIAVLLGFFLWRRKRRRPETPPPPIPPHEAAERALKLLAGEEGLDPRAFYFRLSVILREYIEGGFGLAALEMTTEELLPRVDGLELPGDLAGGVKALSLRADPVKFAGAGAGRDAMNGDLSFVRRFVEETRPRADDV